MFHRNIFPYILDLLINIYYTTSIYFCKVLCYNYL
nr:MAG TPA: hypothetical protein [Caudoviricetes sp.]